jgi:NADH-quinone oxidoreductase subunit N
MGHDLALISPHLIVLGIGLLFLALEVFKTGDDRAYMGPLAAALYGVAIAGLAVAWRSPGAAFEAPYLARALSMDAFAVVMSGVILLSALATSLLGGAYAREHDIERGELYAGVAFATLGMLFMVSARDLATLFVALEVMSLAIYVLVALRRRHSYLAVESALKYFILGSVASAILLMAIAFVYAVTGTFDLHELARAYVASPALAAGASTRLAVLLFLSALAFKVAAVPFHFWTPDAYQGAPTPITGFMATAVKVAAFGILARVLLHLFQADAFYAPRVNWMSIVYGLAIVTMIVGNATAIVQDNVKRMLAWSSVAHAGYLLIGVLTIHAAPDGAKSLAPSLFVYLMVYTLANLLAFGVLSQLKGEGEGEPTLRRLDGFARRHPLLGAGLALSMFSLAGIPPTAGFIGKFFLFREALTANTDLFLPLVLVAIFASLISVYYYVRPIVHAYMREPEPDDAADTPRAHASAPAFGALAVLAAGVLIFGLFPGALVQLAERATADVLLHGPVATAQAAPALKQAHDPRAAAVRAAKPAPRKGGTPMISKPGATKPVPVILPSKGKRPSMRDFKGKRPTHIRIPSRRPKDK